MQSSLRRAVFFFLIACTDSTVPTSPSIPDSGSPPEQTTDPSIVCAQPELREERRFDREILPGTPAIEHRFVGAGIAAADLDGVPGLELILPGPEVLSLWTLESGRYVEVPGAVPAWPGEGATGASVADADGDGDLDLMITRFGPPDVLLLNDGTGHFTDATATAGGVRSGSRAVLAADLDGDGWLDLISRELGGSVFVHTAACGGAHWLGVRLVGPGANRFGIGATIEVQATPHTLRRTIEAGSTGFDSGGPPEAHFGLGDNAQIDAITVSWPDGSTTHHPGPAPDRWITITAAPDP